MSRWREWGPEEAGERRAGGGSRGFELAWALVYKACLSPLPPALLCVFTMALAAFAKKAVGTLGLRCGAPALLGDSGSSLRALALRSYSTGEPSDQDVRMARAGGLQGERASAWPRWEVHPASLPSLPQLSTGCATLWSTSGSRWTETRLSWASPTLHRRGDGSERAERRRCTPRLPRRPWFLAHLATPARLPSFAADGAGRPDPCGAARGGLRHRGGRAVWRGGVGQGAEAGR